MSERLVALVRERISGRFYDAPQVIDAIARGILRAIEPGGPRL